MSLARCEWRDDVHLDVVLLANRTLEQLEQSWRSEGITHAQYVAQGTSCPSEEADVGIPVGAVADGLLARAADTTRLIDRLEQAGRAERLRNPNDRRAACWCRRTTSRARSSPATTADPGVATPGSGRNLTAGRGIVELGRLAGKASRHVPTDWSTYLGDQWSIGDWDGAVAADVRAQMLAVP